MGGKPYSPSGHPSPGHPLPGALLRAGVRGTCRLSSPSAARSSLVALFSIPLPARFRAFCAYFSFLCCLPPWKPDLHTKLTPPGCAQGAGGVHLALNMWDQLFYSGRVSARSERRVWPNPSTVARGSQEPGPGQVCESCRWPGLASWSGRTCWPGRLCVVHPSRSQSAGPALRSPNCAKTSGCAQGVPGRTCHSLHLPGWEASMDGAPIRSLPPRVRKAPGWAVWEMAFWLRGQIAQCFGPTRLAAVAPDKN